ncbi:iron ABC transporter permease [Xanthomonadaceae bacterium JHOS43]|nr:iron ABC transporter permease [Xanthomonadaceae bacterium JHOS43]
MTAVATVSLRGGGERFWSVATAAIALLVIAPLLALTWNAAQGSEGLWSHLARHVLPRAGLNTAILLVGVGTLAAALGIGSAWLVSAYEFRGRGVLSWALLLPLAMPTYIVAYAYLDLLHPLGPVQSVLRALLGVDSPRDFRLPDIRSLAGCIVLLGFVLYPYVYLTVRAMFLTQAGSLLEAARSLGASRRGMFFRVALPMARPALAVGVALALLETLNDIGASEFLGVQTLTVAIYSTWISRSDLPGAAQIALGMLVIVSLLIWLERHGRRRQRYAAGQRPRPMQAQRLHGVSALIALVMGGIPVLVGFLLPAIYLAWAGIERLRSHGITLTLRDSAWNTVMVAASATLVTLLAGLAVAWALRLAQARRRTRWATSCLRVASLGYAVPGTVLAIGLLTPLAWVDIGLGEMLRQFGGEPRMWLMGSVVALVLAYMLRFLAIGIGSIDAGLTRISPSLDQAARSLGDTSASMLRRVHLPLLRPALAAGALLVFVDAMKELPVTLMLRPVNFETLATWLYADAARGAYEDGAVAAFLIVLIGLAPVALLARSGVQRERTAGRGEGE